jgi:hypothetical protein
MQNSFRFPQWNHLFYFLLQGIFLILKCSKYFICLEFIKKMSIFAWYLVLYRFQFTFSTLTCASDWLCLTVCVAYVPSIFHDIRGKVSNCVCRQSYNNFSNYGTWLQEMRDLLFFLFFTFSKDILSMYATDTFLVTYFPCDNWSMEVWIYNIPNY